MKIVLIILTVMGALAISVGIAYALTFNEPVNINGKLQVIDNNLVVNRLDGGDSGIVVRSTSGANTIQFLNVDSGQIYRIKQSPDGTQMQWIDAAHNRADLAVDTTTGNIGIGGIIFPAEKLDVNGNLMLRGNIVSPGDICIGNCP